MLRRFFVFTVFALALSLLASNAVAASFSDLTGFDATVGQMAVELRDTIAERFERAVAQGRITEAQLFDTFYVPIPNTTPQKFHTQNDRFVDETTQVLLDASLKRDKRLKFVVIVDRNGYLPTHNSKFTMPLTGNPDVDTQQNRAKRIFNDRTGLAAARNTEMVLLQSYARDTGEMMKDLSVPIFIKGTHWGSIRFGYQ